VCGISFTPYQPGHTRCQNCFKKQRGADAEVGQGSSGIGQNSIGLPSGYLDNGYFVDPERGVVLPELLTTEAYNIAESFANANVSMSQVRRYFTMARFLEDRLKSNQGTYDEVANELRRMRANVSAVVGRIQEFRERQRLTETLKAFIEANVDAAVADEISFKKGFLPHFECVLGYFYWHNSQKGGRRGT
jgi:CRISPR type III-A-associated protein Csm2